jgi:O-antigen/teichoic acid export membrane protein
VAAPVFVAILVLAPELVPVVFGDQWTDAVGLTQILCVSGLVFSVTFFDRSVLYAAGRPTLELVVAGLTAVGTAVASYVGAQWGLTLVCVLLVVRTWALWPLRLVFLRRVTGLSVPRYLAQWARPVLSTVPSAAAGIGLGVVLADSDPLLRLVVCGLTMALVYALALLVLDRRFVLDTLRTFRSALRRRPSPQAAH